MNPDEYTLNETYLEVGDGHKLYLQEWGNSEAKHPIIFLHGGPGSQAKNHHKSFFDPVKHRVIFYDQRGAGKSLPAGQLKNNTTNHLIEDIEKIAGHFNLNQLILVGGSWGSCLALAYALKHPDRIKAMVLNGIFTGSSEEIDWLKKGVFKSFYPDIWEKYLNATPNEHHSNPTGYHFDQILNGNPSQSKISAYEYSSLEAAVMSLDDRFTPEDFESFDPAGIRLAVHYLSQTCFMPDRHILNNAEKLKMPIWLVQGRYDTVCPPQIAFELNQKLPNSQLIWTTSNHRLERESWNVIKTILSQWG